MAETRIGYTCQGGDPMAFTESECVASGGSWIGQEMPEGTPDFTSITGGGFNNVVDNASAFIQYPGQSSLTSMNQLSKDVSPSNKMGYTSVSNINLSGFDADEQVKIKSVLSKVDQLGENVDVCSSIIQSIVDKNMSDIPKTSAILAAYKSASNLIECGDGLDVITKTKEHIDTFIQKSNMGAASSIVDRLSTKMDSNLFTALPSTEGPVTSCVCHGGDPMAFGETDCLESGGSWVCEEVNSSSAAAFNTNFIGEISSLEKIADGADGMCADLREVATNLHSAGVALINRAATYLEKMSTISSLSSSSDPCGTLDSLVPEAGKATLALMGDALSGTGPVTSCVCHGGDPMAFGETDCLESGGSWVCEEIESVDEVIPFSTSSIPVDQPITQNVPTISTSAVTDAVKMPIGVGSMKEVNVSGANLSVNNISGTLHATIQSKISGITSKTSSLSPSSLTGTLSPTSLSSMFSFNGARPGLWTKADGTKMTAQEIEAAQSEYT
jgi:hypothetical protein